MTGTGFAESRGARWRSVLMSVVVAVVCYGLGVLCMWEVWKTRVPFDDYLEVLIFFAFGILFGLIGGVFLGRALWSVCTRSRRGIAFVLALVPLNLAVFTLLGKPLPTESHVTWLTVGTSAVALVSGAFLVATNSYLLGFVFLPEPSPISRRRSGMLLGLLYGSVLAGLLVGFQTDFWGRGFVPFDVSYTYWTQVRQVSWKDALDALGGSFPPEITVEEDGLQVRLHAPGRSMPFSTPVREVIEATGPVVMVGEKRVEFHGYAMIPAGTAFKDHAAAASCWSLEGRPLPTFPGLGQPGYYYHQWCYWFLAYFSLPENRSWDSRTVRARLVQLPWGLEGGSGYSVGNRQGYTFPSLSVACPVPGPAELSLVAFIGEEKEYTIPAREGEKLVLETNRLLLVRMLPRPWKDVSGLDPPSRRPTIPGFRGSSIRVTLANQREMEWWFGSKAYTTAVFHCDLAKMTPALRIEAMTAGGESVQGECYPSGPWLVYRFPAEMGDIRQFQIWEVPGAVEIRYPLAKLQGFPPENENCSNRLDVLFPSLPLEAGHPDSLLGPLLSPRVIKEGGPFALGEAGRDSRLHHNVTVRDVLNRHYPGKWCVSEGHVIITKNRFGPIVWKVREAVRELREGEP